MKSAKQYDEDQNIKEAVDKAKKDENASGIDALTRDIRKTGENIGAGAKEATDMAVNDIDDSLTEGAQKIQKDVNDSVTLAKNDAKKDLGIGTTDKRDRFANADKLTENIKSPEKDDEIYMSRKQKRYCE